MSLFRKKLSIEQLKCKDINAVIQDAHGYGEKPWKNVSILVVDDQEFAHLDGLQREYGFNVRWMKDISPDQAQEFDIVLCDFLGVGIALSQHNQGGALAKEIKNRFPSKFVVLYTSSSQALGDVDALRLVDDTASPGNDLEDFAQKLKGWCAEVIDPKRSWIRLRRILLEHGATIHDVAEMEDTIVSAWNKNPRLISPKIFGRLAEGVISNLLSEFVVCLVKCAPLLSC